MTINYVIYSYIATIKAGVKSGFKRLKKFNIMKKVIVRKDLMKKAEYSKKYGVNRVTLDKEIQEGKHVVEQISGTDFIKLKSK